MIRRATGADKDAVWSLIAPVFRAGETMAVPRDITRDAALAYWMQNVAACFVADVDAGAEL